MRHFTTLTIVFLLSLFALTVSAQTYGGLALAPGFPTDPAALNGVAGGSLDARRLGTTPTGPCTGLIAQVPDHTLTLQGSFNYLAIGVMSQADTTLVVQTPSGALLCSDDALGLNPAIEGSWSAGTYHIYVGTFGGNAEHVFFATELQQNLQQIAAMSVGNAQPSYPQPVYPPAVSTAPQGEAYHGATVDQAMGNSFSTGMCITDADCGVGTCVGGSCMTNWSGMMHDTTMSIIDNF